MFFAKAFLALAAAVSIVNAQSFDASSVDKATKDKWCLDQTSSCPLICGQVKGGNTHPLHNTCNSKTLAYHCVCNTGTTPNASEFSQTIPYYECMHMNDKCVSNCKNGDSACQTGCRTKHPCGAQHPKKANLSTASTTKHTASATASATQSVYTAVYGSGGTSGAAAVAALRVGQGYGSILLVAGFIAGFVFII